MATLLEKVEKELNVPRDQILREGVQRFLEIELKNLSVEISKIGIKYGVESFDELWQKLDKGEVSESECFEDLTRIEWLEIERDKILKLLEEHG